LRQALRKSADADDPKYALEYALDYAMEYGLACALKTTLENPADQVAQDPAGCGLIEDFAQSLEHGLAYILEDELRHPPDSALEYAQKQALEYARKSALGYALDFALENIGDAARKSVLKTALAKALDDALEDVLKDAVENVLKGEAANTPFIWPVEHPNRYVTSTFHGSRRVGGGRVGGHQGVDIIVPKGTPVVATADGTVSFAGSESGYGYLVRITHADGLETWYAHLDSFDVDEGDPVSRGQEIGEVGQTGRATAPHLHYEVHQDGVPVDPESYLP
jgi:murein DD-endopeptidase MepM/ murein hydrolase activator NlpD